MLSLSDSSVMHPVLCTEPLLNPSSARTRVAELMFETYVAPLGPSQPLDPDPVLNALSGPAEPPG
jgi:hypothetical protein